MLPLSRQGPHAFHCPLEVSSQQRAELYRQVA